MPANFTAPTLPPGPVLEEESEEVNLTDTIVTGVRALDIKNDIVSYTADPGDIVSDVTVVSNGKTSPPGGEDVVSVGENGS